MKKKIYKAISILLTLVIVFSACLCVFNTVSAATEKIYYVAATGRDDRNGTKKLTAVQTLDRIIELANAEGLGEGDTVIANVLGTTNVSWCPNDKFELTEHDFKLIVQSDNADGSAIIGTGVGVHMGGDTEFKNIGINFGSSNSHIFAKGHNVTFGQGARYVGNATMSGFYGGANSSAELNATDKPYTLISEIPIEHFSITNLSSSITHNADINVIYHASRGTPTFYYGTNNGETTFNAGVNIVINSATSVAFNDNAADNTVFGENGYMQILNHTVTELTAEAGTDLAKVPSDKLWILNNKLQANELFELTDTKGKYKINTEIFANVKATSVTDSTIEISEEDGYLTLPAGVYNITASKLAQTKTYYVEPNGIEIPENERPSTAGTEANPVKTYADATRLIAMDGLTASDVAIICIPSSGEPVDWGTEPAHFACQAIITSKVDGSPGELQTSGQNSAVLTGNTTFRNINVTVTYQYGLFRFGNYNLTIEKDAKLIAPYTRLWENGSGVTNTKDVEVRIEGIFQASSLGVNSNANTQRSTGNYTFYVDNPETIVAFEFGANLSSSGPNVYDGNINIIVKKASSISFNLTEAGAVFNGSVQMLVDGSVGLPYNVSKNFNEIEVAGGKWYITNDASDDEFVSFGASKGVFDIKGGAKAYSRQFNADNVEHTGGVVDLASAPGAYIISDKEIAPLTDDSHKMLYFRYQGGKTHLGTRAPVTPGETYIFEYNIYTSLYEDCSPTLYQDGTRSVIGETEIISETKVGDYYSIVAECKIPENYAFTKAFFTVTLAPYSEGVIFDRTVYKKGDETKTDLFEGNQKFHDGLDRVTSGYEFWGGVFSDERGPKGATYFTDGNIELRIMNYDPAFIKQLIAIQNPNDGEWWEKDDIVEEDTFATYAKASGTFKDHNGKPVSGAKMMLVSDAKSYTARTNASGKFNFGTIVTGFYELFVVNGSNKISTGYSGYISQDDVVTFDVVTDTSSLSGDLFGNVDVETESSQGATSSFTGTVYTPQLDTVTGLKIVLKGVGEVVTDEKGTFGFANVPVGTYELYAINEDDSEYFFREIEIEEGVTRSVKLKYDAPVNSGNVNTGWVIYIIIAAIVALLAVGGLVVFLILRKKKVE